MFNLVEENAKLTSVNPRSEFHGEEHQLACDLKFKVTLANSVLDDFHPELRPLLFKKPAQEDMDLMDQAQDSDDYLVALRFPEMSKISWGYEGAGYRMLINIGVTGNEDVILINTEIDNFKFDAKTGGSVDIEFRVKGHPNETEMGRLCALIQHDVYLTLEPPSAEKRAQMEMDAMKEEAA